MFLVVCSAPVFPDLCPAIFFPAPPDFSAAHPTWPSWQYITLHLRAKRFQIPVDQIHFSLVEPLQRSTHLYRYLQLFLQFRDSHFQLLIIFSVFFFFASTKKIKKSKKKNSKKEKKKHEHNFQDAHRAGANRPLNKQTNKNKKKKLNPGP